MGQGSQSMNRTVVCRLAIADPPYLGRGAAYYGPGANGRVKNAINSRGRATPNIIRTTEHPDAHLWDLPETHQELVSRCDREYDGWAIALARDSARTYWEVAPESVRMAVWVNPRPIPSSARIQTTHELVMLKPLLGRPITHRRRDVLICTSPAVGHIGSKPPQWTRWVLDMLGYDQDTDTVDDLFGGSGAVSREIAQQVMNP
jgi:hypothetical protein